MKQYTINDINELLSIIQDIDTVNLDDLKDLHELNTLFLVKRNEVSPTINAYSNIKAFLNLLKNYKEEYQYLKNEIYDLSTKIYFYNKCNFIRILYLNKFDKETMDEIFTLNDEYIVNILCAYYHKEFKYDTLT